MASRQMSTVTGTVRSSRRVGGQWLGSAPDSREACWSSADARSPAETAAHRAAGDRSSREGSHASRPRVFSWKFCAAQCAAVCGLCASASRATTIELCVPSLPPHASCVARRLQRWTRCESAAQYTRDGRVVPGVTPADHPGFVLMIAANEPRQSWLRARFLFTSAIAPAPFAPPREHVAHCPAHHNASVVRHSLPALFSHFPASHPPLHQTVLSVLFDGGPLPLSPLRRGSFAILSPLRSAPHTLPLPCQRYSPLPHSYLFLCTAAQPRYNRSRADKYVCPLPRPRLPISGPYV
ncbi:uncharacterized protein LAESUDRAFT_39393 [Laetiporus sulphureus 93-53]|uniref:Uncharacterized protein n=1 Tax=Laetiporus sulphureus 93-53 TaxID=1314785 RepID=A0A165IN82_9APHY|nr:uncharacterized protein LAESUDRAFT_39393 [Laetiporus sulphureus 93-53]KZT13314.1 hypothetical protein LAESUDRAFT_39393 [Laetiporus sulphureus 93-53]